jgi:hypothetical protein
MFQKMCHKNIQYQGRYWNFLLLITTNSDQTFPKMASPKCSISIFGNAPLGPKAHIILSISFFRNLTLKSNSEYLNEISTKHLHTTIFRKLLTKAT